MDIRRSITCGFWTDGWVESINTEQKLLFLYLLTNPLSNILGIYKISIQRMSFETGINSEAITEYLKDFERLRKAYYIDEFVIIVNHLKHQALNPNMKTNVVSDFNALPNELKNMINGNTSEGFKSLSKSLQTLSKIEIEIEIKKEIKKAENFEDLRSILFSENEIEWRKNIMEVSQVKTETMLADFIGKFLTKQKATSGYFPKTIDEVKNHFLNWILKQAVTDSVEEIKTLPYSPGDSREDKRKKLKEL